MGNRGWQYQECAQLCIRTIGKSDWKNSEKHSELNTDDATLAEIETTRDFKSFLLLHLEWDRYSSGELPHTCLVKSEFAYWRKDIRSAQVGGFLWNSSLDFNSELLGSYSTAQ